MICLKTHIGSKHKPGDIVADDALDATLTGRLIAEGRAERVKASDQTAQALRAAYHAMTAAMRSRLRELDQAVDRASADELGELLATKFEEVLATARSRDGGDGPKSLSAALDNALEAHRAALFADAEADAKAKAAQDAPPAKDGKTITRKTSSGTARKASSTASSGAVEGGRKASPKTAKAGGQKAGKPVAGRAKDKPASGEPTDSTRSGAGAARGIHNPEAVGSNPSSAPKTPASAAAGTGSDVPAKVPGGQPPLQAAERPDGSGKAEADQA